MHTKVGCRSKRGFTMQEMLLVVLMFAILAGLAIPGVIALQRSLHMKKLDEYARQIYVAAQNELTNMKASGRLELLESQLEKGDTKLESAPSDYPEGDSSWSDLYYVTSSSEVGKNYFLRANDSLQKATESGGSFIIELNPSTGDVYSVFYAEDDFSYDNVTSLAGRAKSVRKKAAPQLGYYAGDSGDSGTAGLPTKFEPKVEVINGEELAVKITCKNLKAIRKTQTNLKLTIYVSDEHGNQAEFTYKGGTDLFISDGSITLTKVLDSLEKGNQFADVLPDLTAGDDLNITVKMEYQDLNRDANIMGEATAEKVNSLFAQKSTDESGTTVISVDHVRHLNNLRSSIYSGATAATVNQTGEISFQFSDWKEGEDYVSKWEASPIDSFPAITNDSLFTKGSYNGNQNAIKYFTFSGDDSAALFGSLTNTTLENIRLVDCSASGTNAATLAGAVDSCTITNCGAYLSTQDDMNAYYSDMTTRRSTYSVTGSGTAGGLIAIANNSTIENSFGAVDVSGGANNGGLVGQATNTTVSQSYGSGNITASGANNGGLIGQMTGGSVTSCYATGKVTAPSSSGGLLGASNGGTVSSSYSCGRVTTDGETENASTCGGFVGTASNTSFSDCEFLQQAEYNIAYPSASGISNLGYTALRHEVSDTDHIGLSKPYQSALRGQGYPFRLCKNGEDDMVHYGDWPEAYRLQTSLVYYERYSDGNYGYYAVTSLTSGDESAGEWVVNSLRDEYCVEDGYALLTVYDLSKFDYKLDTAATSSTSTFNGTVNIVKSADSASSTNSLLLLENADLKFTSQTGSSGQETTISNAKVYRLPFAMQITARTSASSFWEKLTVTGYSSITGKAVFSDTSFYYCPDFAKNAVNAYDGNPTKPDEPGGDGSPVYVRSPRQLNGLSRSTYYWNTSKGGQRIQFIQEVDLDYGKYTTNYCGVTYNLMDTSSGNEYRNQPIGRPGSSTGNNFQNSYDGQCNKIIDYCCEASTYQFTGLFGETEKCVLKNIVMVASKPYESAYVRSTYSNNSNRAGTGVLAGLAYVENESSAPDMSQQVWIENCSVSGYLVSYTATSAGNYEFAIGGLVGVNFGTIRNCSAVCEVTLTSSTSDSHAGYVGGLVGSINGLATIDNCYAGGKLIDTNQSKADIGGICGGCCYMWGLGYSYTNLRNAYIRNSYSYCTLENFTGSNIGKYGVAHPTGVLTITDSYYLKETVSSSVSVGDSGKGVTADTLKKMTFNKGGGAAASGIADASHSYPDSSDLAGSAYPFPAMVVDADGNYVHYGDWPVIVAVPENGKLSLTQTTYLVYYEQYEDGTYSVYSVGKDGKTISNLSDSKTITATGYAFLTSDANFAAGDTLSGAYQGDYKLIAMTSDQTSAVQNAGNGTVAMQAGDQTLYVNGLYAKAVYTSASPSEFLIRTADQLAATSGVSFTFTLDRDITASSIGKLECASGATYNGNGKSITGLTQPLFNTNNGTLNQLKLTDVNINVSEDTAALALTNNGTIQCCYVSGTVKSSGNAAGLVLNQNGGSIIRCAVTPTVTGSNAAGVVYSANSGTVKQSYYSGTVSTTNSRSGTAAGFCMNNSITLESCFASVSLSGGSKYGLASGGSAINYSGYKASNSSSSVGTKYDDLDFSGAVTDSIPNENWPNGVRYGTTSQGWGWWGSSTTWTTIYTSSDEESSDETNIATASLDEMDGDEAIASAESSATGSTSAP